MSIDRAATLRQAENLVRQGKLDQAITEYNRLMEEQPQDWNTANVLGDLYVRAGRLDRAIEQFGRIADNLAMEGFHSKASALYKKVLKIQPGSDHALLQSGELAAQQGLLADARRLFAATAHERRQRGDLRGAWEVIVRAGRLDADDVDARLAAARARLELDDLPGALDELNDLAARLIEQERDVQALAPLREVARLDPGDGDAAKELARILLTQGLNEEAAIYLRAETAARDRRGEKVAPALAAGGALAADPLPAAVSRDPETSELDEVFEHDTVDPPALPVAAPESSDIEAVFARLRDGSAHRTDAEASEAAYTRGAAYFEAGELEQSVAELRVAARAPRRRFAAASLLARIFQQQGRSADAAEWLGHAADAPGLADAIRFDTLARLAELLETTGEPARALAVCLELQADAGDSQDLAARIARLSRAQGGG